MSTLWHYPALPDEVLEVVLNYVPLMSMGKTARLSLLLCCRKWASILEAQLFSSLILRYDGKLKDQDRIAFLLNLLDLKPYLCRVVRSLNLQVHVLDDWIEHGAIRLLHFCSMIETFTFTSEILNLSKRASYNPTTDKRYVMILRKVGSLAHLKHLSLRGVRYQVATTIFANHKLQKLYLLYPATRRARTRQQDVIEGLHEYNPIVPTVDELMARSGRSSSEALADSGSVPSDWRPGASVLSPEIRELIINLRCGEHEMANFLRWPRGVKAISLENQRWSGMRLGPMQHSTSELTSVLQTHRHSLVSLSVTGPHPELRGHFDFSCLENLRLLKLTSQLLCKREGSRGILIGNMLSLPCLEVFQIDFHGRTSSNFSGYGNMDYAEHSSELMHWMELFAYALPFRRDTTSKQFTGQLSNTTTMPDPPDEAHSRGLRVIRISEHTTPRPPRSRPRPRYQYRLDWWRVVEELLAPCRADLEWVGEWPDRALEQRLQAADRERVQKEKQERERERSGVDDQDGDLEDIWIV